MAGTLEGITDSLKHAFNSTTPSRWDQVFRLDIHPKGEDGAELSGKEYAYFVDLDGDAVDVDDSGIRKADVETLDKSNNVLSHKVLTGEGLEEIKAELVKEARDIVAVADDFGVEIRSHGDDFKGEPMGEIRQEIRDAYRSLQAASARNHDLAGDGAISPDVATEFDAKIADTYHKLEEIAEKIDAVRQLDTESLGKYKDAFVKAVYEDESLSFSDKLEIYSEMGYDCNELKSNNFEMQFNQ